MTRNRFMLRGLARYNSYDWWWHSLVAIERETGQERPFFFEYFVINPGIAGKDGPAVLGDGKGRKPSYAMIKAGAWGIPGDRNTAVQIDNCWPIADFRASTKFMDVAIGPNRATETAISGAAFAGPRTRESGWPSQVVGGLSAVGPGKGVLSWDLKVKKTVSYSVGYGASAVFNALQAFRMFWHVGGMKCEYEGTITLDGKVYDVFPERSYGYQDKNWGRDYTNPWIWLNCNNFHDAAGTELGGTSLDVGGGRPVAFGISLPRKILVAFKHRGRMYEYNFSKFWSKNRQDFSCTVSDDEVRWQVRVENRDSRLEADFSCPKETMLRIDYENPKGFRDHKELWNGGWASGTLTLYRKTGSGWEAVETLTGKNGGCEYGAY